MPLGNRTVDTTLVAALTADPGVLALALSGPRDLATLSLDLPHADGLEQRHDNDGDSDVATGAEAGSPSGTDTAAVRSVLLTLGASGLAGALTDEVLESMFVAADGDARVAAVMIISTYS